jgi:hypothetical protein
VFAFELKTAKSLFGKVKAKRDSAANDDESADDEVRCKEVAHAGTSHGLTGSQGGIPSGLKPLFIEAGMRPKAEALGYLDARAKANARAKEQADSQR